MSPMQKAMTHGQKDASTLNVVQKLQGGHLHDPEQGCNAKHDAKGDAGLIAVCEEIRDGLVHRILGAVESHGGHHRLFNRLCDWRDLHKPNEIPWGRISSDCEPVEQQEQNEKGHGHHDGCTCILGDCRQHEEHRVHRHIQHGRPKPQRHEHRPRHAANREDQQHEDRVRHDRLHPTDDGEWDDVRPLAVQRLGSFVLHHPPLRYLLRHAFHTVYGHRHHQHEEKRQLSAGSFGADVQVSQT
mmetsp:Transcript_26910/g.77999  ORF Transcript_26910/g.77999 Transcript_26910/m.77999 type:complete len:242 (+) Transcript_26910:352-1077(+)